MKQTPHLPFTKMHGLGNDFAVINALQQPVTIDPTLITALANRHTGIGFDQLLIIESADDADFFCRIYNADGSEAEQCGNGLRCVARLIHEDRLHASPAFSIATKGGIYPVQITDYNHIKVTMGTPDIHETLIELPILNEAGLNEAGSNESGFLATSILNLGNPHAVIKVDSLDNTSIHQLAPAISAHTYFPEGVNVGFMQVINPTHIRLRTFERGAGETFACGSNACAAAMAGILNGWLNDSVTVEFRYGTLQIDWEKNKNVLHMTGPATRVFNGVV